MEAAFQVAEHHGYGLDPLFVGQVFQPLLLNLPDWHTVPALLLRFQIQVFQFIVGECQKIAQFVGHGCPSVSYSLSARMISASECTEQQLKWLGIQQGRITRVLGRGQSKKLMPGIKRIYSGGQIESVGLASRFCRG